MVFLHLKRDIGINIMIESAQMYAHICLQSVFTSKSTGLPDWATDLTEWTCCINRSQYKRSSDFFVFIMSGETSSVIIDISQCDYITNKCTIILK